MSCVKTTHDAEAWQREDGPWSGHRSVVGTSGGSKFEGIGVDERTGAFYVSEVTGREIHRGQVLAASTQQWLGGDCTDGRFTACGVTVDDAGRVYIAGGPNGIDHPGAPDLWVYSPGGRLLAALRTGVPNAFLNNVAIGPDGATYFTNSNAPQVFRLVQQRGTWSVQTWADATATISTAPGIKPRRHRRRPRRALAGRSPARGPSALPGGRA